MGAADVYLSVPMDYRFAVLKEEALLAADEVRDLVELKCQAFYGEYSYRVTNVEVKHSSSHTHVKVCAVSDRPVFLEGGF